MRCLRVRSSRIPAAAVCASSTYRAGVPEGSIGAEMVRLQGVARLTYQSARRTMGKFHYGNLRGYWRLHYKKRQTENCPFGIAPSDRRSLVLALSAWQSTQRTGPDQAWRDCQGGHHRRWSLL